MSFLEILLTNININFENISAEIKISNFENIDTEIFHWNFSVLYIYI